MLSLIVIDFIEEQAAKAPLLMEAISLPLGISISPAAKPDSTTEVFVH
jgi:hypothetical protein